MLICVVWHQPPLPPPLPCPAPTCLALAWRVCVRVQVRQRQCNAPSEVVRTLLVLRFQEVTRPSDDDADGKGHKGAGPGFWGAGSEGQPARWSQLTSKPCLLIVWGDKAQVHHQLGATAPCGK